MSDGTGNPHGDAARDAAHAWLARLRGPHGSADEAAFENWYAADPAHAAAYDAVLESWDRTAALGAVLDPATHTGPAGQGRGPWPRRAIAVAAGLALAVTATLAVDPLATPGGRAEAATLASRVGEIRTVALSDGSRITLDTDTEVEVSLSPRERRFRLRRGRARFAVGRDAARPFVVLGGAGAVEARGTLFDAELRGSTLIVSLMSGALDVRGPGGRGGALAAGQRLTIAAASAPARPIPLQPGELRWPSGMLSFENAPLDDVVAAANRYAATPIRLADGATRAKRFTGTVRARDQLGLARLLAATFNLSLTPTPDTLVLGGRDGDEARNRGQHVK